MSGKLFYFISFTCTLVKIINGGIADYAPSFVEEGQCADVLHLQDFDPLKVCAFNNTGKTNTT